MTGKDGSTPRERWARLRFSVVAPLLAAPPERGDLRSELERLAAKTWRHPVTGDRVAFSFSTVERWYYRALATGQDPLGALARKLRDDAGKQPSMGEKLRAVLRGQWQAHKGWSYQLHYDNLGALAEGDEKLRPLPSYATVRRYMRRSGLVRKRGVRAPRDTAGAQLAEARLEEREVRSYEAEYVGGLWHLDFHDARRTVLTRDGQW